MASLENFGGLWGIGPCCLVSALGWLGQGNSDLEGESLITEVFGGVGSGLISLYLKSMSWRGGLLLKLWGQEAKVK